MAMTSLSPGTIFKTTGLNQSHTPVKRGASKREVNQHFRDDSKRSKKLRSDSSSDSSHNFSDDDEEHYPDSPVAEVYDVQNSSAKLVLLNNDVNESGRQPGSKLRAHSATTKRSAPSPSPGRHATGNTPKKNTERHTNCMDSSSPRFKPHPPAGPKRGNTAARRRCKSAGDNTQNNNKNSRDDKDDAQSDGRKSRASRGGPSPVIPSEVELYKRYFAPPKLAAPAKRPPISMSDYSSLVDKRMSKGGRKYMWSVAQVYDVSDQKRLLQIQYKQLLLKQARLGFHTYAEYEKYLRYFEGNRKGLFSTMESKSARRSKSPTKSKKKIKGKTAEGEDDEVCKCEAEEEADKKQRAKQTPKSTKEKVENNGKSKKKQSSRKEDAKTKEEPVKKAEKRDQETQKDEEPEESDSSFKTPTSSKAGSRESSAGSRRAPPGDRPKTSMGDRKADRQEFSSDEEERRDGDGEEDKASLSSDQKQKDQKKAAEEERRKERQKRRERKERRQKNTQKDDEKEKSPEAQESENRPQSAKSDMAFLAVVAGARSVESLNAGSHGESKSSRDDESDTSMLKSDPEAEKAEAEQNGEVEIKVDASPDQEEMNDGNDVNVDEKADGSSLASRSSESLQKLSPREGVTRPKSRLGNRPTNEKPSQEMIDENTEDEFHLDDTPRDGNNEQKTDPALEVDPRNAAFAEPEVDNKKATNSAGESSSEYTSSDSPSSDDEETPRTDVGKVVVIEKEEKVKVAEVEAQQNTEGLDETNNNAPEQDDVPTIHPQNVVQISADIHALEEPKTQEDSQQGHTISGEKSSKQGQENEIMDKSVKFKDEETVADTSPEKNTVYSSSSDSSSSSSSDSSSDSDSDTDTKDKTPAVETFMTERKEEKPIVQNMEQVQQSEQEREIKDIDNYNDFINKGDADNEEEKITKPVPESDEVTVDPEVVISAPVDDKSYSKDLASSSSSSSSGSDSSSSEDEDASHPRSEQPDAVSTVAQDSIKPETQEAKDTENDAQDNESTLIVVASEPEKLVEEQQNKEEFYPKESQVNEQAPIHDEVAESSSDSSSSGSDSSSSSDSEDEDGKKKEKAPSSVLQADDTIEEPDVKPGVDVIVGQAVEPALQSTEQRPTSPEQRPTSPEQRPTSPEQRPTSPEQRPTSPEQRPTSPEQRPTSPEQRHTSPQQRPTSPEQRPTSPEQRPTSPEQRPTIPEQRPTSPEQRHTSPQQRPTSPEQRPTSPEQRPTSPEQRPTIPKETPDTLKEIEEQQKLPASPVANTILGDTNESNVSQSEEPAGHHTVSHSVSKYLDLSEEDEPVEAETKPIAPPAESEDSSGDSSSSGSSSGSDSEDERQKISSPKDEEPKPGSSEQERTQNPLVSTQQDPYVRNSTPEQRPTSPEQKEAGQHQRPSSPAYISGSPPSPIDRPDSPATESAGKNQRPKTPPQDSREPTPPAQETVTDKAQINPSAAGGDDKSSSSSSSGSDSDSSDDEIGKEDEALTNAQKEGDREVEQMPLSTADGRVEVEAERNEQTVTGQEKDTSQLDSGSTQQEKHAGSEADRSMSPVFTATSQDASNLQHNPEEISSIGTKLNANNMMGVTVDNGSGAAMVAAKEDEEEKEVSPTGNTATEEETSRPSTSKSEKRDDQDESKVKDDEKELKSTMGEDTLKRNAIENLQELDTFLDEQQTPRSQAAENDSVKDSWIMQDNENEPHQFGVDNQSQEQISGQEKRRSLADNQLT